MERLADPLNDRVVKSVPAPPHKPLPRSKMYPNPSTPNVPDLQLVRSHLLAEGRIGI